LCGTACADHSEDIHELHKKLEVARLALEYCTQDDELALDFEGSYDFSSADSWKKLRARQAIEEMSK
jgi:hypothetical protein